MRTNIKPLKNKADKLFSEFIREVGHCEWCKRKNVRFECAHIFSRRYNSTRYEPMNALCLCSGCHRLWHSKPVEAVEWVKSYLGEEVYDKLRFMAKNKVVKSNELFYREIIRKIKAHEEPYLILGNTK